MAQFLRSRMSRWICKVNHGFRDGSDFSLSSYDVRSPPIQSRDHSQIMSLWDIVCACSSGWSDDSEHVEVF